jgi:hypothetical protein
MDNRNRCSSCIHWNQVTDWQYDNAINSGTCKRIREGLDIEVHYGWDGGYVENIETEGNFGCVFHIPK